MTNDEGLASRVERLERDVAYLITRDSDALRLQVAVEDGDLVTVAMLPGHLAVYKEWLDGNGLMLGKIPGTEIHIVTPKSMRP